MAKRRGNGEGSVYRKADGTWCATLTVGFDPNGKRKRRYRYGRTKAEVLEKLSKSRAESLSGLVVDPNQLRMADYLHRWLEDDARPTIRETTLLSYRSVVRNHINPHIGGCCRRSASTSPKATSAENNKADAAVSLHSQPMPPAASHCTRTTYAARLIAHKW